MKKYPITEIYYSIQGEGYYTGLPMLFIRLAGCSIGCPGCDTNYSAKEVLTATEILERCKLLIPNKQNRTIWITGGEPTDHDLKDLLDELYSFIDPYVGDKVIIATSGHKAISYDYPVRLSVSPHDYGKWVQRHGMELKIIPGLGNNEYDCVPNYHDVGNFVHRYVQPLWNNKLGCEDPQSLDRCIFYVNEFPFWRLSLQAHKYISVK